MMEMRGINRTTLRRWITKLLAFITILTYGVFIVSTPKQLHKLLDAAFDSAHIYDATAANKNGFRRTPYHRHIYTIKHDDIYTSQRDANVTNEGGVITTNTRYDHNHNHTSSNNNNNVNNGIRISFELHDPKSHPVQNIYNLYVTCPLGKVMGGPKRARVPTGEFRTGELPPSLYRVHEEGTLDGYIRSGRVLDFTVTIRTDLKLLLIGDSVMVQLAQAFDEMVGGPELQSRKVVWEAWNGHDGGTVVAPTFGGGVSALWRMTGLLSQSKKGKPPANSAGGGWSDKEINALGGYSYPILDRHNQINNSTRQRLGKFDVVIFRVMHGWMKVREITHDRLVEAVELSYELLGATTVVLMTIPFTNNVKDMPEMILVNQVNDDIRNISRTWHTRNSTGVQHVLVMEYGTYYNHIIWSNARFLGYQNLSHPLRSTQHTFDTEGQTVPFLQERLKSGGEWPPSISMVCSDMTSLGNERNKCNRNYLFQDGMHICPEKVASRYGAGLACLIGCVHNRLGDDGETISIDSKVKDGNIRDCERECNEQFMSIMPVEESWIDTNTTLASFGRQ